MLTYASYTRDSREFLKSIAHKGRLDSAARFLAPSPDDKVLDYGCGDAHLLTKFLATVPIGQLAGYDPDIRFLSEHDPILADATLTTDIDVLLDGHAGTFTKVACFEVCEHLTDEMNKQVLDNIRALAAKDALVVFGVPIETGPAGAVKTVYRTIKGGRTGATMGKAVKSFFGASIEREFLPNGWTGSHIGFNHKRFGRFLEQHGFSVTRRATLPFSNGGAAMNNEVYFFCRIR